MNDRIKELILAAGFPKFDKMYVVSDGEELEKFAELIIQQCAEIAIDHMELNEGTDYNIGEVIKGYFGVE